MTQPAAPQPPAHGYAPYPPGMNTGAPYPPGAPPGPAAARTNPLAIVSLVTAIVLGAIPLIATVCGFVALAQIRRTGERGRGLAIAGVVLGLIGCAMWIAFWVLIAVNGGSFHYSVST